MELAGDIRQTFFQECTEQLAALEEGLIAIDEGTHDLETINAVFRAVHSVKGGAGAFKLTQLVSFAHVFETTLDLMRSEKLDADKVVLRVLFHASDILADMIARYRDNEEIAIETYEGVLAELETLSSVDGTISEDDSFADIDFTPTLIEIEETSNLLADDRSKFEIAFRPRQSLLTNGNDPIAIIRELARLGDLDCKADTSSLPDFSELDCDECYIGFDINLHSHATRANVMSVFEFVEDDCTLKIDGPIHELPSAQSNLISTSQQEKEYPAEVGDFPEDVKLPTAIAEPVENNLALQASGSTDKTQSSPTIRVDLGRVDNLINLVGELVINKSVLSAILTQPEGIDNAKMGECLAELERLTRDIQDSVMTIRAQPAKTLFQRMQRIVREVAGETGKKVRLRLEGEATEVDKTVIDQLVDPLTHMIRNAVDHGLESPELRLAAGKQEEGTIKLTASHRSGKIVMSVSDDGAGINRPKVLEIARSKNLIPSDAQLSDTEIDQLLFLPGFSTAKTVSSISGRGVGMDVVKRSIQALGGRTSITSVPGEGTVFTLNLPLTLAVLDGIVVRVSDHNFVLPLTSIVETFKVELDAVNSIGVDGPVIRVRNSFVPVIDVGQALNIRSVGSNIEDSIAILVESANNTRCALIVDRIVDQRQVVIKSLEKSCGDVPGVAAATILGDGRVALIIDIDRLVTVFAGSERQLSQTEVNFKRGVAA